MPNLMNSQRRLYKATYAPVRPEEGRPVPTRRGISKAALIASLAIRPHEMEALTRRLSGDITMTDALSAVAALARDGSASATLRHAEAISNVDAELLLRIGDALVEERQQTATQLEQQITSLRDAYRLAIAQPTEPADPVPPSEDPGEPLADSTTRYESRDALDRSVQVTRYDAPAPSSEGLTGRTLVIQAQVTELRETQNTIAVSDAGSIEDAIAWAASNQPDVYQALHGLTTARAPVPLAYSNAPTALALSHVVPKIAASVYATKAAIHAFKEQMKIEPVGRLHLERLEMTPVGVERGELVSSVPLTPKETVNISHREWSVTVEEYESIIRDYFEGFSEQGVSEKLDVAQSTENQSRHSSALSFNAAASGSYLGVTLSSSFGYSATSDDQQAQKDSRNHSISSTRHASARVRKDHKTSFRVSSVVGTEDQSVRVITNPSDTDAMRVDYYQLMRKWRVDLYRYGLRMTYDIVIPSPGADLMRKIEELAALDAQINTPFEFSLKPTDITRSNWDKWASHYQAKVDPPPRAKYDLMSTAQVQKSADDKDKFFTGAVEIDVDTDYELTSGHVMVNYYYPPGVGDEDFALLFDVLFDHTSRVQNKLFPGYPNSALKGAILGRTGRLSVPFIHRGVVTASIMIAYTLTLRSEVFDAWRFRAWTAIRSAAEQLYLQSRQQLKDKRAALAAELAPFDALTLRRMEMEEIEKGVLRWLFGPSFNLSPAAIQSILGKMAANDPLGNDALDPSSLSVQQWQRMMEFGEFIKYVQHAIEWENILYFTYPYFWDRPQNWTLKQFLQYPDALHRTFLRAGSARVVLTIRPGFEHSFAQLMETGAFGALPGDHPYVTIAEEIQNYAKTNYPGIPPANPENPATEEEVNAAERGVLQATWWEYTPTSALDLSINTVLAEMA